MKILYAIQGTGNGHLSRARDIIPALRKVCRTDILVSGYQADVKLPYEVDYSYRGLSFMFGKRGGIDLWNTYVQANLKRLIREIMEVPVENYDFVINDFEPVTAWSCYRKKVPCVSLSHQSAVLNSRSPKPFSIDLFGKFILANYAPSNKQFGFHFGSYTSNIFTPVIRQEIRTAKVIDKGHYTVYLPAYGDDKLIKLLSKIKGVKWQVFSKHTRTGSSFGDVEIMPIDNDHFIDSFRKCRGLLTGAGFEGPAEALFMGKKLLAVPMKLQYEQMCNAAALKKMGVPVLSQLKEQNLYKVQKWVDSNAKIEVEYPDITDKVIRKVFESQIIESSKNNVWDSKFNLEFQE